MKPELFIHKKGTILGEGPIWDHRNNTFWWVDIPNGLIHRRDWNADEDKVFDIGQMVGAAIPCQNGDRLILAMLHGFAFFDPNTGNLEQILDPEADKPSNRFNDGKCDPYGRLWAGTMCIDPPRDPAGSLYCLDNDLNLKTKMTGVRVSNGLAWNKASDRMFYIDTRNNHIMSFNYDLESGEIKQTDDLLKFDALLPDGMTIDEDDNLWVAFYSGKRVCCFDSKNGAKLEQVEMPVSNPTSCTFGGQDLDTLLVTTGNHPEEDRAGAVFAFNPGVRGVPTNFFNHG